MRARERKKVKKEKLADRIKSLHQRNFRALNDAHIFVAQAVPALENARDKYAASGDSNDRPYYVPSLSKGMKIHQRTDDEMRDIFNNFLARDLYGHFIVSAVAQTERFLLDVLREILTAYPQKLFVPIKKDGQGKPQEELDQTIPLKTVLGSDTIERIRGAIIEKRLTALFYASPKAYLQYLEVIVGKGVTNSAFEHYIEIKATRDLIAHNGGVANAVYLGKAGKLARATEGVSVPLNRAYFDQVIACLRRISYHLAETCKKTFKNA